MDVPRSVFSRQSARVATPHERAATPDGGKIERAFPRVALKIPPNSVARLVWHDFGQQRGDYMSA